MASKFYVGLLSLSLALLLLPIAAWAADCGPGNVPCNDGCMPAGATCVGNGKYCPADATYFPGTCCPAGYLPCGIKVLPRYRLLLPVAPPTGRFGRMTAATAVQEAVGRSANVP